MRPVNKQSSLEFVSVERQENQGFAPTDKERRGLFPLEVEFGYEEF